MPAYLLARVAVHDAAGFAAYQAQVSPVVAAHGGRYLVRGGVMDVKEGAVPPGRLVVVEFPTMDAARAFYDSGAYAPVLRIRLDSAESEVVLVDGVASD